MAGVTIVDLKSEVCWSMVILQQILSKEEIRFMNDKNSIIRVGLIGAGANTHRRHIPGFQACPNVSMVTVANRSFDSSQRVAQKYDIPSVSQSWQEVVLDPEVDAVCIGTWPYLHQQITCAALEAGKHVLCEARMAMDLSGAREMLRTSRAHPHLVAQLVPTPLGLPYHQTVRKFLNSDGLGKMLAVEVRDVFADLTDPALPLMWRQRLELAGYNYVSLGQWWEMLLRWVGPVSSLDASASIFVDSKKDPATGKYVQIQVPDHISVIAEFENGALGNLLCSAITGNVPESSLLLHGTRGTLKYDALSDTLWWSNSRGNSFTEMPLDPSIVGGWRGEEEFINAVRGQERVKFTDFETGVSYMELSQAAHISWSESRRVNLPLD